MLQCITSISYLLRTELGYCGIEYKQSTGTTIDAFAIFTTITNTQAIKAALAESTDGKSLNMEYSTFTRELIYLKGLKLNYRAFIYQI